MSDHTPVFNVFDYCNEEYVVPYISFVSSVLILVINTLVGVEKIRFEDLIRIRILTSDSIWASIRTQTADSQVPNTKCYLLPDKNK